MYTDEFDVELACYYDSDWARNPDDMKSSTRYVFNIGWGAISWSNEKKPTISLSSIEVEYKALSSGTCKAVWLRTILEDVGEKQ